jgi:uncharacterized protein (TIGR02301 family)
VSGNGQHSNLAASVRHARQAIVLVLAVVVTIGSAPARAQDQRPYDDRLMRLSEILGAVHYLRELCGGTDGQLWRERMQELLNAEGSSALRRVRLTRSFNQGWSNYRRTYTTCTPSAETAITKFLAEGSQIADTLVRTVP